MGGGALLPFKYMVACQRRARQGRDLRAGSVQYWSRGCACVPGRTPSLQREAGLVSPSAHKKSAAQGHHCAGPEGTVQSFAPSFTDGRAARAAASACCEVRCEVLHAAAYGSASQQHEGAPYLSSSSDV